MMDMTVTVSTFEQKYNALVEKIEILTPAHFVFWGLVSK